jgi:hypothetical protein
LSSEDKKDHSSALQLAFDKEKIDHISHDNPDDKEAKLIASYSSSTAAAAATLSLSSSSSSSSSSPHTSLRLHIPEPPVPPEVLKNVVLPAAKRPTLTHEEFKQKKLIRKMVYELDLNWRDEDFPVIKRLSWYLLKDIQQVQRGDSLWTGNEEAVAMGLLISGRLEAVTALSSGGSAGRRGGGGGSDQRTLQVIMPGTLIGAT